MLFALPIVVADCAHHKIPNIYLLLFSYSLLYQSILSGFPPIQILVTDFLVLSIFAVFGFGAGDLKLIFLIAIYCKFSSVLSVLVLILCILLVATTQMLVRWCVHGDINGRLPLAFSIFLGLGLYLAT